MNDPDTNRGPDERIDELLRAAFAPPPERDFAAAAQRVVDPAAGPRPAWPWFAAAAALLAIALVLVSRTASAPVGRGAELGALWAAAYEDAAASDFQGGCCGTGFDLPQACQDHFDCRIGVRGTGDVAVLGDYCGREVGDCMMLIARDGERTVCVCVVPRTADPGVELPAGSRLHLTRRELGDVVLYALAPEPADAMLGEFVEF
ncbi:MAG: hypothetical protein KDE27_29835 [Planctomycetes bacterium]|nr:hypothetical protein [Planctomycetota bacterium]